jgi:steroid 5-alpha reductase family enzyme
LKQALCQNKKLAEQLYSKQTHHSGEDARWRDINHQYSFEMLKTLNLLIGIVVSGIFIYYNRK